MKPLRALVLLLLAVAGIATVAAQSSPPPPPSQERELLSRVRRLTVEGRRAGEGYWSPDGKRLVFQSEREPGNPFYQIYMLTLATGDTKRISPGCGKTTCAFFRPTTGDILFASTHHDPQSKQHQEEELAFRASGKERRYSWDYDPEMEHLRPQREDRRDEAADERAGLRRRSAATRPTASGSCSRRCARLQPHAHAAEQKQLETDPSLLRRDLHHERPTAPGQKRLTDGATATTAARSSPRTASASSGAASTRQGLIADVWTMKLDGTDERQITDFGAMSWAPYIHPSGQYFLFASNKLGFENFEVFMVDIDGHEGTGARHLLRRLRRPAGAVARRQQLAWTSSRGGGREGQIFSRSGTIEHGRSRRCRRTRRSRK